VRQISVNYKHGLFLTHNLNTLKAANYAHITMIIDSGWAFWFDHTYNSFKNVFTPRRSTCKYNPFWREMFHPLLQHFLADWKQI